MLQSIWAVMEEVRGGQAKQVLSVCVYVCVCVCVCVCVHAIRCMFQNDLPYCDIDF